MCPPPLFSYLSSFRPVFVTAPHVRLKVWTIKKDYVSLKAYSNIPSRKLVVGDTLSLLSALVVGDRLSADMCLLVVYLIVCFELQW